MEEQLPLRIAALCGHYKIVSFLLKHGANPNAFGQYYDTPLRAAIFSQNFDCLKELLKVEADPNFFRQQSKRIEYSDRTRFVNPIKKQGGQFNINLNMKQHFELRPIKYHFNSALREAALSQKYEFIQQLLKAGAKASLKSISGFINEYQAAKSGSAWLLNLILQNSGHPNMISYPDFDTPLRIATQNEFFESMKLLISYGAKAQQGGKNKETPITTALRIKSRKAMDILSSYEARFAVFGNGLRL